MRKTQDIGPAQGFVLANWAPLTMFAVAYVAILGILFAPEGFFDPGPAPVIASE